MQKINQRYQINLSDRRTMAELIEEFESVVSATELERMLVMLLGALSNEYIDREVSEEEAQMIASELGLTSTRYQELNRMLFDWLSQ